MVVFQTAEYTNIGGRKRNEDSVQGTLWGNDGLLLVVADGLGGHGGGEKASQSVCRTICQNWNGSADPETLATLLTMAHGNVLNIQTPQCAMKSTAVVLAIRDTQAAWAHVGDTRLYHFLNGKLVFQTRDHSASQLAVMLGQITPQEIRFHEDRNRVLRALGQEGELSIEASHTVLEPGRHAFLLCSDGFWEYVLEEEMELDLRMSANEEEWIRRMHARLCQRIPLDNDNNTAAAVWCDIY